MRIKHGIPVQNLAVQYRASATSTAALVDLVWYSLDPNEDTSSTLSPFNFGKILFQVVSVATNGIDWVVLGSNDGTNWTIIVPQNSIAVGAQASAILSDAWIYAKVQIIDTIAASHGDMVAIASLKE